MCRWCHCVAACLLVCLAACRHAAAEPVCDSDGHCYRLTADAVISSPVAWDWDGDGIKEIAVGSWDGYFYLVDHRLRDLPGWPKWSGKGFFSSPALTDLDGDGRPEVLVGSEAGMLFAWRFDGADVAGFPIDLGYPIWASPTALDAQRIAIGDRSWMRVLDRDGHAAAGWPQPIEGWPDATVAAGRGILALTTLTPGDVSKGWIYAWRENGELLDGYPVELEMDSDSSPALADLDGDGTLWIIFGDDQGWLHVMDLDGRERAGFPVRSRGPKPGPTPTPHPPGGNVYSIEASPAVADLEGDGRYEIAVGSWDGRMYVWDDAGGLRPGWPVAVEDQIISSAALVDLDGDEQLDLVVGSKDGHLYGWVADGEPLPGFPYALGSPVFSSPWVGDLEGDGRADIVVGTNNGIHVLRGVGSMGASAWPMFHQDEQRQGTVP